MARKKIREYDSKRLLKEHFKRLSGKDLPIKSAQVSILNHELVSFKYLFCYNVWLISYYE
jgi:ATP citrate (pro-S)-lyase